MIGRTNAGGGGTGATLIVTAPENVSVKCTNGAKTYTRASGSTGIAKFTGLPTGTWTVTCSNSSQTSPSKTVTITADYTVTVAFFSATIEVTYPSGSTVTCTDGTTKLTASTTTGSYTFTVPNTGTWTITSTSGSSKVEKTVSITSDGQSERVTIDYTLSIYDNGTQNVAMTLIKDTGSTAQIYFSDTYIRYGISDGAAFTTNAVDLSSYNNLVVTCKFSFTAAGYNNYTRIFASKDKPTMTSNVVTTTLAAETAITVTSEETTFTLDISALSGDYYVGVARNGNGYIYEIKLTA